MVRANLVARKTAPSTMSKPNPPKAPKAPKRKRTAYNLEDTVEVIVGKQFKRFTIHTSLFTGRSGALAAVQQPETSCDIEPIDLKGEDPELFQAYLNCVYFGCETLEQWADASKVEVEANEDGNATEEKQEAADAIFEKLIRLYLLAERLVDFKTVDLAVDEIVRTSEHLSAIPTQGPVSLAYSSTVKGSPLRTLLRDFWTYDYACTGTDRECLRADGFPSQCVKDIAIAMLAVTKEDSCDFDKTVEDICSDDVCRYHQHDELHPRCVPADSDAHSGVSDHWS